MRKSCLGQSLEMFCSRFRDQDIFERIALARDLQVGIRIGAFEIMMQVDQQAFDGQIVISDLLGQDKNTPVDHSVINPPDHRGTVGHRQELQRVVHDDHGGVVYLNIPNIGFLDEYRSFAGAGRKLSLATRNHRRRKVNGMDLAIRHLDLITHGCRRGTQRAAQVVAARAGRDILTCQGPDSLNGCVIARNRTAQHVRKDGCYCLVEFE